MPLARGPAHGRDQRRVDLADVARLDLDVLLPGLEPVLAPDLQHVVPGADARGAEVRARLLAATPPSPAAPSSQTSPPGGSLVSSKPVSGDGSSVTVSASGCPALSSMF